MYALALLVTPSYVTAAYACVQRTMYLLSLPPSLVLLPLIGKAGVCGNEVTDLISSDVT